MERPPRSKATDPYRDLVAAKVQATDGRISAKRLLPPCRAAGYAGSARSLRRAVALATAEHRRGRRAYRPWQPVPGEHLVIDWSEEGPQKVFCAVLAWSRWRFVRLADSQDQATTLELLAECFELTGGVPATVLADRMGGLKGGVVANVVVPAPGLRRLRRPLRLPPRLLRGRRPRIEGPRREPRGLREDRPPHRPRTLRRHL